MYGTCTLSIDTEHAYCVRPGAKNAIPRVGNPHFETPCVENPLSSRKEVGPPVPCGCKCPARRGVPYLPAKTPIPEKSGESRADFSQILTANLNGKQIDTNELHVKSLPGDREAELGASTQVNERLGKRFVSLPRPETSSLAANCL